MRAGGYTIQHTLTPEAATIVKQSLGLARRRGHAQVTPLHVASAMLTSPTSLLRKACLQPNSHPYQWKALELCFNVALNRLPTIQSSPIMLNNHHPNNQSHHHPSLSNALVAAFKRAQAHQRRGSIENQQQPILALKVEIEQLIISILDDPSVSRVMREAGFSSTQVKNNIEQMEIISSPNPLNYSQSKENIKPASINVQDEEVMSVIEMMMNRKRKNIVVIRECLASGDAIVRGVIKKFESENSINLRFMQFVSLPLHSLNDLSREDVEDKVRELKCLVKSFVGRGVILYLGDLNWVSDYWSNQSQRKHLNQSYYYSPMEHMIMELSGLMFGVDSGKLWLMGIANSQTYMRCKTGHPSLETLWDLCPLTLPVASLDLTLNLESKDSDNEMKLLNGYGECSVNLTRDARTITSYGRTRESISTARHSSLPSWLQQYKEDNSRHTTNDQECEKVGNLCKKWNSICTSFHQQQTMSSWPVIFESNNTPKEHQFFIGGECFDDEPNDPKTLMPELLSNPNSSPNSASCSEASYDQNDDHDDHYYLHKFKEMNSENVKILSNALERVAPWQREIIPEIVTTILQCRSGTLMEERKEKEETWLSFLGADNNGKEKIARELAKVIFGSRNSFVQMGLSRFSATRAGSTDDDDQEFVSNKRARDENGQSYFERFTEAVHENPNRVFFLEDIEQVDYHSQMGIKKAIKNGRISVNGGETVLLSDAIVIFGCESFSSISRACSPSGKMESLISLDLNIATEDHSNRSNEHYESVSDVGILDLVDKQVIFKLQML